MIHIFSTELKNGKGGISTALVGYVESLRANNIEFELTTTHSEGNKIRDLISSCKSALSVKKGDVCWFHCGPWFSMLRKTLLILLCKTQGAKIVIHFHSRKTHSYLNNVVGRCYLSFLYSIADNFVVLTKWWKSQFSSKGFTHKVVVSPNPIDQQILQFIKRNQASPQIKKFFPEKPTIDVLSMARLVEDKGLRETISAFQHLPPHYHLHIGGTGPLENELRQQVNNFGLQDRVHFLGWVDYEAKLELFSKTELFCLPSRFDSFGMVYLEALSANIPVVALNFQAIPDVVPEGMGVLIDNDDPVSLACAIKVAAEMRDIKGDEYVLSKYSPEPVTKRFLKNVEYSA
ncbi:TPA: glycosyltransferase family 4 protein [Vibrio alginolyticus]|uniref:glycosyltransferase family 4 protein n=1 Tax=Vibrio TaxID=662 RepID=UPI00063DA8F9|nr:MULTISPECIES: glycosyltransferase family 4 protein [Vibrio]KLI70637.1 hypothetical protein AAW26_20475 [Vibrio alginolyticus]MCQ9070329.1 glycosyltransferase family 4 protein [Vibrio alginolyticus]MDM4740382.1 glycosyltransferase family 4 protein [Vibrio alginolyticus]MDM4760734.1 glycosyltransferase family 4 protein [Vibrio alginolyticus]MDW1974244.1 glycosyltransferase family 4 protein [Vibrio sp. Vb1980]